MASFAGFTDERSLTDDVQTAERFLPRHTDDDERRLPAGEPTRWNVETPSASAPRPASPFESTAKVLPNGSAARTGRAGISDPHVTPVQRWTEDRVRAELAALLAGRREWPSAAEFVEAGQRQLRDMVYRFGGSRRWARELGLAYPERIPGHAPYWTEDRVREELRLFLAGVSVWPSRNAFEAAGRKALRDAVNRTGGPDRWGTELGVSVPDLRRGSRRAWTEARIEAELRRFLAGRRDWPAKAEFERAGLRSLLGAIYRHGGGPDRWARRLGVRRSRHAGPVPDRRTWSDERIERELRAFTTGADRWPGSRAFADAGLAQLYREASLHGGIPAWRRRLGL
jgi:hypothetical protein